MKSKRVTQAWEFYRDNTQGYKEPMRREFRKLDEHVFSVEAENAELRELARKYAEIANYFCERESYCSRDFVNQCRYDAQRQCKLGELNDTLRGLGVEVEA